jgi:hypothetical protein
MIIYTNTRSRKKKSSTKQKMAEYQTWLKGVQSTTTNFASSASKSRRKTTKALVATVPIGRDPYKLPSLSSDRYDTFKKQVNQYTGDKLVGIGTMHKSNAVPIFSEQDAKDQANMRR